MSECSIAEKSLSHPMHADDDKSKLTIANPSSKYDIPAAFIVCTMMILLRIFEVPRSLKRRIKSKRNGR